MDQQQHHHQHLSDDQNPNIPPGSYGGFYSAEQDPSYGLAYNAQMPYQQVVPAQHQQHQQHHGPPSRQLSATDLHQGLPFHNLSLVPNHAYSAQVYTTPQHVSLPGSVSPPPQSPMYDPLSPPISGSDSSTDGGIYHHSRNSSGTGSPSSSRGNSLVHRHSNRYNPTPSPTTSSSGRRRGRSLHDSDDDEPMIMENLAFSRKEATRKQRIEAEQRRRDELRDGYAKLKDVLPVSNQKSSKVSLLERATNHIVALEKAQQEMQMQLATLEQECARLRAINEKISLGVATTPSPGQSGSLHSMDSRPLSPPPETGPPAAHSLSSVKGQEPPRERSRSPLGSVSGGEY